MASIQEFAFALSGVVAPNQFRVNINFPTIVSGASNAMRKATYLTKAAQIPQTTVGDVQLYYRGKQYHEAGETEFQPWSCTIYNTTDFGVRKALEEWSHKMRNPSATIGITIPASYKGEILIQQLDRNGGVLRGYKLIGAFPQDIAAIQLDYDSNNQAEMFDCTFVYDYCIPDDSTTLGDAVGAVGSVMSNLGI